MIEKIMVVAPTTARTDEDRLCGGLEGVARPPSLASSISLGALEVDVDVVVLLKFPA